MSAQPEDLEQKIKDLSERVAALERAVPSEDRLTLGLITGDLDMTMAAFIVALGARAYDIEVDMFVTFWALAAFRDPHKKVKKGALDTLFDTILPSGSTHLPLSHLQMVGIGPRFMRKVMSDRGVKSLEQLIREAAEQGVKIHACAMTMDMMGIKEAELIDYPGLDIVGVGQFVSMMSESRHCWFF